MTCSGCKLNNERVKQGYSWTSEKTSPIYKCTCSRKEKVIDSLKDWLRLALILPFMLLIVCLVFPFYLACKLGELIWEQIQMDGLKDYLFKHWLDWVYALAVIYSVFCAVGLVLGSYVLINLGFTQSNTTQQTTTITKKH